MSKFDFIIGNPPYQASNNNMRLYPSFYENAKEVGDCVEMIFPNAWRESKNTNGLSKMNNENVKRDKQIVLIQDKHNVFNGISGAEWTNIILWKKGYDNGLDGKQKIIDDNGEVSYQLLPIDKDDVSKPKEIVDIVEKVNAFGEDKIMPLVSTSRPYGFRADPLDDPSKYSLTLLDVPSENTVRLFGKKKGEGRTHRFINRCELPKVSSLIDSYKLFVVKAWGNMDEKKGYLGGSYSSILIGEPRDCCSEMYIEVGPFNSREETENARKYFYSKFFRAVFYKNKLSQNTARETYSVVPMQDFSKQSDIDWSKSIHEIDVQLYEKYGLSDTEIQFIEDHIKEIEE